MRARGSFLRQRLPQLPSSPALGCLRACWLPCGCMPGSSCLISSSLDHPLCFTPGFSGSPLACHLVWAVCGQCSLISRATWARTPGPDTCHQKSCCPPQGCPLRLLPVSGSWLGAILKPPSPSGRSRPSAALLILLASIPVSSTTVYVV